MLRRIQWQWLNPIAPWLLAAFVLWLCWQIAASFGLIAAPPQPPLTRDVALRSQPNTVPNLSAVQLFKMERPDLTAVLRQIDLCLSGCQHSFILDRMLENR